MQGGIFVPLQPVNELMKNKRQTDMKRLWSLTVALCLCAVATAQVQRPKLIVGLVVDQMRWDYLYYYYDRFGEGGLRRLVDGGYSFENTMINYVPTVTAIGHASIYTGSVPALHGIAGNNYHIGDSMTYCVYDKTVRSVGSDSGEGQMSPRNLLASGIGDMLKIATDYKAKVIGVALKDRAAILPAGHAADAAYWWDTSAGHFVSSTYYMPDLPEWVKKTNKRIAAKPGTDVKTSVEGVAKTFEMAEAALVNERMGQDDVTDMLAVSVSSTDAIGHQYGTRGKENTDVYMELDRQIARFLSVLDEKVGRGNYLLFLSADHGGAHNPNYLKAHRMPAGGLELWSGLKDMDMRVRIALGVDDQIILEENATRIYLNHANMRKNGLDPQRVKQAVIDELERNPNIMYAVDYDKALTTAIPQPVRERIVNGYNKRRSGDIIYVAKPNWENVSGADDYPGTTHSMWNPYDSHIPFVLYGWNVSHGQTSDPTYIVDIAPTVCAMLHIQMPNSCVGNAKSIK